MYKAITKNFCERIGLHLWLMLGLCVLFGTGCVWLPVPYPGYEHCSFKGRFVDAETHEPIEGVEVTWPIVLSSTPQKVVSNADGSFEVRTPRSIDFGYVLCNAIPVPLAWVEYMKIEHQRYGIAYIYSHPYIGESWMMLNYPLREKMVDCGTLKLASRVDIEPAVFALWGTGHSCDDVGPFSKVERNCNDSEFARSHNWTAHHLNEIATYEKHQREK